MSIACSGTQIIALLPECESLFSAAIYKNGTLRSARAPLQIHLLEHGLESSIVTQLIKRRIN